jgi:hypothetical protein
VTRPSQSSIGANSTRPAPSAATLRAEAPGSLALEVGSTRVDASQVMFVHAACLMENIHEGFPFEAEMFEPHL